MELVIPEGPPPRYEDIVKDNAYNYIRIHKKNLYEKMNNIDISVASAEDIRSLMEEILNDLPEDLYNGTYLNLIEYFVYKSDILSNEVKEDIMKEFMIYLGKIFKQQEINKTGKFSTESVLNKVEQFIIDFEAML